MNFDTIKNNVLLNTGRTNVNINNETHYHEFIRNIFDFPSQKNETESKNEFGIKETVLTIGAIVAAGYIADAIESPEAEEEVQVQKEETEESNSLGDMICDSIADTTGKIIEEQLNNLFGLDDKE